MIGKNTFLAMCIGIIMFFTTVTIYMTISERSDFLVYILFLILTWSISSLKRYKKIRGIIVLSYIFYSFWGILACYSYFSSYNYLFAPYSDDQHFFGNIMSLMNGQLVLEFTLYEVVLAFLFKPLSWLCEINLLTLLPFNWIIGAFVVGESLLFVKNILPKMNKSYYWGAIILFIFNANIVNGVVHLYRDGLMCLFLLLAFNSVLSKSHIKSIFFSILTGLIRGANGFIALAYAGLNYIVRFRFFAKKSTLILCIIGGGVIFIISDSVIGYSTYLRSFSSSREDDRSLLERTEERQDTFLESAGDSGSGTAALLQSNNPIKKMVGVPIFMLSPLKMKSMERKEISVPFGLIERVQIEFFWELIHIIVICCFFSQIFIGLYYLFRNSDIKLFILGIIFLLTVFLIAFISMQQRHRMAYVIFFPLLYSIYRENNKIDKKYIFSVNFAFGLLIFAYNII